MTERLIKNKVPSRDKYLGTPGKLYGNTSVEKRLTFVEHYFLPIAREIFELEPRAVAVYLSFAQYWNDEANDAVHYRIFPLVSLGLTWEETFSKKNWPLRYEDFYNVYRLVDAAETRAHGENEWGGSLYFWDNSDLIRAFASFTKEGSDQEKDDQENYLPYLLCWWEPGKMENIILQTKIVGVMQRPHLENAPTLWEKRHEGRKAP